MLRKTALFKYSKEEEKYERMKITIGNYTFHTPLGKLRLNEFVLKIKNKKKQSEFIRQSGFKKIYNLISLVFTNKVI